MPRYIDADELISWIVNEPSKVGDKDIPLNNEYDGSAFRQIEILGHIESMPTADVVERKDLDEINEAHERIGYDRGFRDGYAQAIEEMNERSGDEV